MGNLHEAMFSERNDGNEPQWMTVAQLAERLALRESHVRALVRRGELPVVRIGRLLRFHWPAIKNRLLSKSEGAGAA